MRKKSYARQTITAIWVVVSLSFPAWAQNKAPNASTLTIATPFGVVIGKTTCRQAVAVLKMNNPRTSLNSIPASVQINPEAYPETSTFAIDCRQGADTPVTTASLKLLGGVELYNTVVSDLASKYKKIGFRRLGGITGLEFQTSNGNVMVYSIKTYNPAPIETLISVRYHSLDSLDYENYLDQQKNEQRRAKDQVRRDAL